MSKCPLCQRSDELSPLAGPDKRAYLLCNFCKLIHSEASYKLTVDEEKARYLLHNNSEEEPGYVQFLSRSIKHVKPYADPLLTALDYGCGPAPVLAKLVVAELNIPTEYYDPYFFNHTEMLNRQYDLVFSTEVFEHFQHAREEINKVVDLVREGGILCIMTEVYTDASRFSGWYYARDPTHMSFFHEESIKYIASNWNLELLASNDARVFVFRKL